MYSFQKEFILIPHSPLIHFQYDSSGAALRATEVKPKLDRYLISHRGGEIPLEWRNEKSKDALNYQLRIISLENNPPIELGRGTNYDIFYGNMGDGPKKKGIKNKQKLVVTCFIKELLDYIEKVIGDFFIVTNFGTMQSKGFGSFTVDGKDSTPKHIYDVLKKEYTHNGHCYKFKSNERFAFKNIKTIYSLIKSGLNYTDGSEVITEEDADSDITVPYKRSILFDYMREKGIGNEKAWMKQNNISPKLGREKNQVDKRSMYVRALLGISEKIEYLKEKPVRGIRPQKEIVSIKEKPEGKDDKEKKENQIERLNSPILFKVINDTVYFVGRTPNDCIYGKTFLFSSGLGKGSLLVPRKDELPDDFMNEFMHYAYQKLKKCKKKPKFNLDYVSIEEV